MNDAIGDDPDNADYNPPATAVPHADDSRNASADNRRWETDVCGIGRAEAHSHAAHLRRLLDACAQRGWVTEDPETYIGLHLSHICEAPASPWRWKGAAQDHDGTYVVDLTHRPAADDEIWADAIALLSAIAEDSFYVRRVDARTFICVTGMLDGDGDFAPHGHTLRLRIS